MSTKSPNDVISKLRGEGKTNERFEVMLNALSVEEIISLKLNLMHRLTKGKFYFPLYQNLDRIIKEAVLRFAEGTGKTNSEKSMLIGVKLDTYKKLVRKYEIKGYFNGQF
jgi:hypothetical protein